MKDSAIFLNIPDPKTSIYAEASRLSTFKPSTGEVVGAYTKEMFFGEGSLAQDIEASNIRKQERRGVAISEDDWKQSDSYREGLQWYEGLTSESAATLARLEDDRNERSIVMERASGLQSGLGFGTSFVAGIFEPKNLASGVAASLVTAGAGSVIPSLGRMIATTTVRGAAARGAVEGVVAAAAVEPSNLESSKIVQGDYTLADSLMNFTLSTVLGAGIGAGAKKLELRGAVDVAGEVPRGYRPESAELGIKEFDTALAQAVEGQQIDVAAVREIEVAQRARQAEKELPEVEAKLQESYEKLTPVTERPEFKAWFEGSKVVDADGKPLVVYHGTSGADFQEFKIKGTTGKRGEDQLEGAYFGSTKETAEIFAGGGGKVPLVKQAYLSLKKPYIADNLFQLKKQLDVKTGADATKKLKELGYDGAILEKAFTFKGSNFAEIVAFDSKDIKPIVKNKLYEVKSQLEADAKLTPDSKPLETLQNKVSNPANSSVYDDIDVKTIEDDFKQASIDDQIAMERNLEAMQEDIQELYEQGLLNSEEIRTLESLADIDEDSAIFDNVLLNAKNCLLR